VPADLDERLGRDPAGYPHPLDGAGVLDVALAATGSAPADVLRTRNVRRDAALGRNPAGLERSRHDLGV
jgi:hypothetical protein